MFLVFLLSFNIIIRFFIHPLHFLSSANLCDPSKRNALLWEDRVFRMIGDDDDDDDDDDDVGFNV